MDPVPDPLLLRKSGSVGNRTRDLCICSQKLRPLDHRDNRVLNSVRMCVCVCVCGCALDSCDSEQSPVANSSGHVNNPSVFIKRGEFLDYLSNH